MSRAVMSSSHTAMKMLPSVTQSVILLLVGCSTPTPPPPDPAPSLDPVLIGDRPGLHNVIRLTDTLYSGSAPDGEAGFRSLRDLGVTTVISVDGAAPDAATAKTFGLRYDHLPVGYDGIPSETAKRLARVLAAAGRDGPVYVHCHHGMHRGPAAAVAGLRCLDGRCSAAQALAVLKMAGTDPKYAGLYRDVENMTADETVKAGGELPAAAAPVSGLVTAMVAIDERWDHLKLIRATGWTTPKGRADLDPAHEVLQLREHFREAGRLPTVTARPAEFRRLLAASEELAGKLEDDLRGKKGTADREPLFRQLGDTCAACHRDHRDGSR